MKRFIAILLSVAIACQLVACSSTSSSSSSTSSSSSSSKASGLVTITLPTEIYGSKSASDIKTEAEGYGCTSYTINDDGSVSYTLTDTAYEAIISGILADTETMMEQMIDEDTGVEGFSYIDYTEDLSQFKIYVNADDYTDYMIMYTYTFFISGAYYQMFLGYDYDDIDVTVQFVDYMTDTTIKAGTYKDLLSAS